MIEGKIQLKHPAGKKAVSMNVDKYEAMKKVLITVLKNKNELTHTQLKNAVTEYFILHKIKFDGNLEWHLEWVKLDMEANGKIERMKNVEGLFYKMK